MGMFSYECRGCSHPLLSPPATDEGINEWMSEGLALYPDGDRVSGEYDGYGRLGGWDDGDALMGAACWHRSCWELAGKPEFDEASKSAGDQGWFFDTGAHDLLDPKRTQFMAPEVQAEELKAAQERRAARHLDYKEKHAIRQAFEDASLAVWEIEDKEQRDRVRTALDGLREEFENFATNQQPRVWPIMCAHWGKERATEIREGWDELAIFGLWFDAMKAQAQVEWLAKRAFEVKYFVPGKTQAW